MGQLAELAQDPRVPKRDRAEILRTWEELRLQCAKEDPWFWCTSLVQTLNEHPAQGKGAYEPFPQLDYLLQVVRTWEEVWRRDKDKLLLIWKSRQMLMSWLSMAMAIWTCFSRVGTLVLIRSRKEADAKALIARAGGILRRLPDRVRELIPFEIGTLVITFPTIDATIEGIPQGAEQVHGRTPTLLIDDELALQEEAESGFAEAQPAIEGGGMYVGVSSARPGFMHRMVMDAAA